MRYQKRFIGIGLCGLLLFTTVGCLKTPEVEYVTNKEGQGTLIEDNAIADSGKTIAEQVQAPERAIAEGKTLNEYTTITVDAEVVIPEGTAIPVYTVEPVAFTNERVEEYVDVLYPTGEFYNIQYGGQDRTKEEIYADIEYWTEKLDTIPVTDTEEVLVSDNGELLEVNQEWVDMMTGMIEEWKTDVLYAPDASDYGDGVTYDFQTQERYLYYWNPTEEVSIDIPYEMEAYNAIGKYNQGEYHLTLGKDGTNTALEFYLDEEQITSYGTAWYNLRIDPIYHNGVTGRNKCKYSYEEAEALCQEFLQELGITDLQVQHVKDLDVYGEINVGSREMEYLGVKGYIFYLYRANDTMGDCYQSIDEWQIFVGKDRSLIEGIAQNSVYQQMELEQKDTYSIPVAKEMAIMMVTDDGIVRATIINPMQYKELLAENVKLLDFEQVLMQGVTQMETLYAEWGQEGAPIKIKIQTIELNYARMQSPDNPEEFAMIPVWDFKSGPSGDVKVSINAIDGTVFNREQGH